MNILFFSRGRGLGHAVPDLAIANELPQHRWTFVSYGTGLKHLSKSQYPVLDLGLPDEAKLIDVVQKLHAMRPADVVVSHEEPAAMLLPLPKVYMAGWLYPEKSYESQCTALANRSLIWCEPGIFPAQANTEFVGPFVRKMTVAESAANLCREFGLPKGGKVVSVIVGAHATEARTPIAELVLEATRRAGVNVLWVEAPARAVAKHVTRLPHQENIEKVIVASDLVITVGNKVTVQECAALGVPTISLSPQTNPMDDLLAGRIVSNVHLHLKAVTPAILTYWIERVLREPPPVRPMTPTVGKIAARLNEVMEEITK